MSRWQQPWMTMKFILNLVDVASGARLASYQSTKCLKRDCALSIDAGYWDELWVQLLVLTSIVTYKQFQARIMMGSEAWQGDGF